MGGPPHRAAARVRARIDELAPRALVLDLRNRLDVHPLIDCGEIDLVLA